MPELTRDEILALRYGATPGPWCIDWHGISGSLGDVWLEDSYRVCEDVPAHDARFIAAAHDLADTALAALTEVEALEGDIETYQEIVKDMTAEADTLRAQLATARAETWEAAAWVCTSFLSGDPKNGIPLRSPTAHECATALRAKAKEASE